MKVGFVVNDIATEADAYTTTRLAMAAVNRDHEAWLIGAGDIVFGLGEELLRACQSIT